MTFGMIESKDTVTIGSDEPSTATSSTPPATVTKPIAERLAELADLRQKNLITEDEYDAKRAALLADV
jgi:Short C-terminal domain